MRSLWVKVHLYVAAFFLPMLLVMATSGGLYLLGVTGSIVAVVHDPTARVGLIYAAGSLIVSLVGGVVALRQAWLDTLPPESMPACGPTLDYIIEVLPMSDVLRSLFVGEGSCGVIQWEFLGITMAGWAFLWFSLFFVLSLLVIRYRLSVNLDSRKSN